MSAATAPLAPWQQRAFDRAASALDEGRFGHGLLICGPEGLGKRAVADALARRVLLGAGGDPRSGRLLDAGTHPDLHVVTFEPNKEGTKLRTEIVIDQVRKLTAQLALTAQYGVAQVAIVDPADAINRAACNALLKTLEEPAAGNYLWLLSAQPARLPATIRSRCQRLELQLPPADEAQAWLVAQGHPAKDAAAALAAARGHPGLADRWLLEGGLALRGAVAKDLQRLAAGQASAVETAQQWTADEHAALRLAHAADLALAEAGGTGLTDPARLNKLAAWFDAANRTRDLLRTPVRGDLAIVELLSQWATGARTPRP